MVSQTLAINVSPDKRGLVCELLYSHMHMCVFAIFTEQHDGTSPLADHKILKSTWMLLLHVQCLAVNRFD
jgi:hypothetical protein